MEDNINNDDQITDDRSPLLDGRVGASTAGDCEEGNVRRNVEDGPIRQLPQYVASLSATLGAFSLGTVLAWTSPTGERLKEGALGFKISDAELSWVGSLVGLGAAISAPLAGLMIEKIGRRSTMVALTLPLTIGWALIAFATNLSMLYAGRIMTGACGGAFSVAAPVYISEIAHRSSRGALGSLFQLMVVMGLEFTYILGPIASVFWLSIISGVIPLIAMLCLLTLTTESPVYLLKGGRLNGAYAALVWLRGPFYDHNEELNNISDTRTPARAGVLTTVKKLFNFSMFVAVGLMFFQQMSGVNDIIFYTEEIFAATGSSIPGSTAAAIVGGVQVAATLLSVLAVDRVGRRFLLILSAAFMAVCCITLSLYFESKDHGRTIMAVDYLPILCVCTFFIVFSLGFGPIPWLMIGELFAPDIKGLASSVVSAVSWGLTFLVTWSFSDVINIIGEGATFGVFGGFCCAAVLFVFICVPETKGRSLEDIQREMNGTNE